MHTHWYQKHMARTKLNQWITKTLVHLLREGNVSIRLSYGARCELEKRVKELLPHTLKMMVLVQSQTMLDIILPVLKKEHLVMLLDTPNKWRLADVEDVRLMEIKDALLAALPTLGENDYRLTAKIVRLFPHDADGLAPENSMIAQARALDSSTPLEQVIALTSTYPVIFQAVISHNPNMKKWIQEGKIKLIKGE